MSWSKKPLREDAVACLVLATLYFLRVWRALIVPARQYHLNVLPGPLDFVVLAVNVLGFAILMFACLAAARRWMGERIESAIVFIYLALLLVMAARAYDADIFWTNRMRAVPLVLLGSGLMVIWRAPALMRRTFQFAGLILLPAVVVITVRSAESLLVKPVQSSASDLGRTEHYRQAARTAWIVFDMFDYDLAFDHRQPDVLLPEFDGLRAESYFARNAASPNQWTLGAIPAMTMGKVVTKATPVSSDDLLVTIDGSQEVSWKSQATIFSEARNAGMTIGVVGWYHPYCRLFGSMLSSCEWVGFPNKLDDRVLTPRSIEEAITEVVVDDLVGPDGPYTVEKLLKIAENQRRRYIGTYQHTLDAATRALTNPELDLVMIHFPVPHTPGIYDRSTQQLSSEKGDYLDNLVLADRTLGTFRRAMEHAGLWETTNILITSDHGFRSAGPPEWKHDFTPFHVPFFLRLGGREQHIEDDFSFNTIVVRDLLLALLKKEIVTTEQARDWLHQNYPPHPLPDGTKLTWQSGTQLRN